MLMTAAHLGPQRERGFTLIEIVVTLIVMALAVAAVAPQITSWQRNTQVRNTADSLINAVNRARNEAVRRNEDVSLWLVTADSSGAMSADCALSNTSPAWVVSLLNPTNRCTDAVSDTVDPMIVETLGRADGAQGAVIAALNSASLPATSITFNGYGRVANTATAITRIDIDQQVAGADARRLRVAISGAGSVRMCDRDLPTTSTDPRKC
jgi:type IV fimbrial biogenesis protein FimT